MIAGAGERFYLSGLIVEISPSSAEYKRTELEYLSIIGGQDHNCVRMVKR